MSESREKTAKDEYNTGTHGSEDAGSIKSSQNAEIKQKKRSRNQPVDVTCPVNLSNDVLERVRDMVMTFSDARMMPCKPGVSCQCEICQRTDNRDGSSNVMIETFGLLLSVRTTFLDDRRLTAGTVQPRAMKRMEARTINTKITLGELESPHQHQYFDLP
jgi:hypothetical protein